MSLLLLTPSLSPTLMFRNISQTCNMQLILFPFSISLFPPTLIFIVISTLSLRATSSKSQFPLHSLHFPPSPSLPFILISTPLPLYPLTFSWPEINVCRLWKRSNLDSFLDTFLSHSLSLREKYRSCFMLLSHSFTLNPHSCHVILLIVTGRLFPLPSRLRFTSPFPDLEFSKSLSPSF